MVMGYINLDKDEHGRPNQVEGNSVGPFVVVKNTDSDPIPIKSGGAVEKESIVVVDDTTFSQTVTGEDISMEGFRNALITVKVGGKTDNPVLTLRLEVKDGNGNYITFDTMPAISNSNDGVAWVFYDLPDTVRVVCSHTGTGSFSNVTVEVTKMN